MADRLRILVAKLGLDIHWRGAVAISRLLRDKGFEVIYIGNQFPEAIVNTAIQENVDIIGLSTLGGNHLTLGPKVVDLLKEKGAPDIAVVMGGTIPTDDIPKLKAKGIDEVFPPDTPLDDIVDRLKEVVKDKKGKEAA